MAVTKFLELDAIFNALSAGNFAGLVGLVEDDRFEAKSQPYNLDTELGSFELAKDVAGLAEALGGPILIGCETERTPAHREDQIKRTRPVDRSLVDVERYHSIIEKWVYPPPEGVRIDYFSSPEDGKKGLFAIRVPEQADDKKPFVLVHMLLDGDRRRDIALGYVQRRRATVQPVQAQDLQRLLRDGKRFNDLQQRIDELSDQIRKLSESSELSKAKIHAEPGVSEQEIKSRISKAIADAQIGGPTFALSTRPESKTEIRGLFGGRNAGVVKAFENRRELRQHGFDLGPSMGSQILENQLRRDVMPGWQILDLWRDGSLIYAADASAGLSWGSPSRPQWGILMNPLALCETTYLFAYLSRNLYAYANPVPAVITYSISLANLEVDGKPAALRDNIAVFADIFTAPRPQFEASVRWDTGEIDVGSLSFQLAAEVFRFFGIEDERIPYARARDDGSMVIDPELIVAAGSRPA
jgi:hypothetical protein